MGEESRHRRHRSHSSHEKEGSHHRKRHHGESSILAKHRKLMEEYLNMQQAMKSDSTNDIVTDIDAITRNLDFIMENDIGKASNWEQRLAIRYYCRLYKEYALIDLSFYKVSKIGMRWRTEREVVDGKGQFSCGEVHCTNSSSRELCSYEVPFQYSSRDGKKNTTLVKVRVCGSCALKLYYRKIKEYENNNEERRKERKQCETSHDIFKFITFVLQSGEEEEIIPPPPPPPPSLPSTSLNKQPSLPAKRDGSVSCNTMQVKRVAVKKSTVKKKTKSVKGRSHYSSSSEEEEEEKEEEEREGKEKIVLEGDDKKEYDASGNEVISTSNDVWKTNIEVEHTETEKMDDFINQLFM